MRKAFFTLLALAGLAVLSGPLALGQQQTGGHTHIDKLRAEWRSLQLQRHGHSKDRLDTIIARREEGIARSISEFGLSPEQASSVCSECQSTKVRSPTIVTAR